MNIGILTFHRAHNYGAVLQCYALQEVLKTMGHNVYVIDYKLPFLLDCYKWFKIRRFLSRTSMGILKNVAKELSLIKGRYGRYKAFNRFINTRFDLTSVESINEDTYDIIIVGSDQVWNTKLTKGFDHFYWGDFNSKRAKIISYAASIEQFWDKKDDEKAKLLLRKFSAISVREKDAAFRLKELLQSKQIEVVIDPTLLVDIGVWERIAVKPKVDESYLLLYQVRNSIKAIELAKKIALERGLRLICLSAKVDEINSNECISASPEEFLGWFKYASFVVCSSFHGTVFSLLFNVPFYSIQLNDGKDMRVKNLLDLVNLNDRLIDTIPEKVLENRSFVDFEVMRNESMNYLKQYVK